MNKRLMGFVFIGIAMVLSIGILLRIGVIHDDVIRFLHTWDSEAAAEESTKAVNAAMMWLIYFAVTFVFWFFGLKWVKAHR